MHSVARLPLHFDAQGLTEDYKKIGTSEWTAHFNRGYFEGDWSGVALHGGGAPNNPLLVGTEASDYDSSGVKDRCPHLNAVIESFHCPLRSARLLKLSVGSIIREHRDYDLGYDEGQIRIHVPVITNPQVEFYLENKRVIMNPGECWYLDLHLPHRVYNRGTTDRIHLVIDCVLNDWLRDLLAQGEPYEGKESSFEDFRRLVLADPALQQEFRDIQKPADLAARVTELGNARGFPFLVPDVEAAMRIARETWRETVA